MGTPTLPADQPAYAQTQTGVPGLNRAVIVTMDRQAARVATGTDQPVELKVINRFIIKIL